MEGIEKAQPLDFMTLGRLRFDDWRWRVVTSWSSGRFSSLFAETEISRVFFLRVLIVKMLTLFSSLWFSSLVFSNFKARQLWPARAIHNEFRKLQHPIFEAGVHRIVEIFSHTNPGCIEFPDGPNPILSEVQGSPLDLVVVNICVIDKVVPALVDLAEITTLSDHKKLGDSIVSVLQDYIQSQGSGRSSISGRTSEQIKNLLNSKQRLKWKNNMPKEDLHIKQAAALVVKLEGNSLFSSGNISGAALKYSEALSLCPMRFKKERVVLYSNRVQCHLLLQQPLAAINDATRTLCLHKPLNHHAKSLWRIAQAYDMLGIAKESLLNVILFINECSQSNDPDLLQRQNKVPDYEIDGCCLVISRGTY
ncbi:hypothetical protein Ahy_B10g102491 [Arachis hypogaea]|uniref:Uncharacterized protein n=1 Tax=Arachis hypogaea TaxID=3818 RepID=A0A444X205_ARAHY|nr:hypothetical protein Ahy_B10g102491 [Arachis hypogaea]